MLAVYYLKQIRKDIQLAEKRGYDLNKLYGIIDTLRQQKALPKKYKDHKLPGNYKGYRECHIEPDWLLIYKIQNNILTLVLARTDTHSDLF